MLNSLKLDFILFKKLKARVLFQVLFQIVIKIYTEYCSMGKSNGFQKLKKEFQMLKTGLEMILII